VAVEFYFNPTIIKHLKYRIGNQTFIKLSANLSTDNSSRFNPQLQWQTGKSNILLIGNCVICVIYTIYTNKNNKFIIHLNLYCINPFHRVEWDSGRRVYSVKLIGQPMSWKKLTEVERRFQDSRALTQMNEPLIDEPWKLWKLITSSFSQGN
jgi:bifunctional pyridoxal-dependent enzyme with beta-cystathionase and maltose regulon repressor activities